MAVDSNEDSTPAFREFDDFFNLRSVAKEAVHLVPYIRTDSRIIDVGCGIGSIALDFARRAPHGYVLGIDYSAGSIATAKAQAEAAGLTNVEFMQGDAMDLPSSIPADSFDISHSHQVLLHLSDPIAALKSIRRVVKPGGILATRDIHSLCAYPDTPVIQQNWDLYRNGSRERGCEPDAGHVNHVWMHEAGFPWENISVGAAAHCFWGVAERRIFANAFKTSFASVYDKETDCEEHQLWLEDLQRGLLEWAEKPDAKLVCHDGWVIGTK